MKTMALVLAVAELTAWGSATARAQSADAVPAPASSVPNAAFFAGLGAGLNATSFNGQDVYAQGVSNIYQNSVQVAYGSAGGSTYPSMDSETTISPEIQFGYFRHFEDSNWLWGAKFAYSYLGAEATDKNFLVPQYGSFTSSNSDTFSGNVFVHGYETRINHQISLIPFIGRSFEKGFIYAGAGPTLSQVEANLNGVIGFAALDNSHVDVTGQPSSFKNSEWVYGGAATVGVTYFFDSSWFLDVSYTYAITATTTTGYSALFANEADGYTDTGIISGNYSGHVDTQSVKLSINRAF